jgi:hypothetical protein
MKKKILLTFDYELFFGSKSGTPDECILVPTNKLLTIFREHNIKGTFFIDVLYYMRLLESDATISDALKIKDQLQAIVAQGSRIELHLHPHWLEAKYVHGEWQFPTYGKFRLQSLSDQKISELFNLGTQILEDIARHVSPEYKVIAFRAGGFCVQPFDMLKKGFTDNKIIVDSSVAPGLFEKSGPRRYDFRDIADSSFYSFTDDPTFPNRNGIFYELPIAIYRITFLSKVLKKIIRLLYGPHDLAAGNGIGIYAQGCWWNKLLPEIRMITLDGAINPNELERQITSSTRDAITVIAHPKSLTNSSFECIVNLSLKRYKFLDIKDMLQKHFNA